MGARTINRSRMFTTTLALASVLATSGLVAPSAGAGGTSNSYPISAADSYLAAVIATTQAMPVPPAGLKAVGQTGESVSLSWGAVADAVEYRMMYSLNADMSGAKYWRFPSTSGTVKYLKPGTAYYFKVRALKSGGASLTGYSDAVSGMTGSSAVPVPPAGLKAVGQTGESVSLSWGAVADAVEYRVMYSLNADMSGAKYWRFPSTSGTVKYLKPGTAYYFKVRALKSGGASLTGYSDAVSGMTGSSAVPVPPAGLKAVGQTGESVSLSWGAVADAVEYRVMYSLNADMSGAKYWRFPSTSGTVKYLKPGTAYYFKVRALKSGGASLTGYSDAVSGMTGSSAVPVPPAGLKAVGQTGESVSLSWGAVADAVEYRVMYSLNADMSGAKYWRFPSTSGTVKYLKPGTAYYFKVRALKSGGASLTGYSDAVSARTGTASPAAPTGLQMSFQTPTALGLVWDVAPGAERYRIALSSKADMGGAVYYRFTDPAADVRGLTPGTAYFVQVRSIKADGTNISAYSPIVRIQTAPAPVLSPVANPLAVASYNIHCANCEDQMETEVPWVDRRDSVVQTIVSKRPDIIGIQEASQGWLVDSPAGGLSQFEDLRNRLREAGARYELTNDKRNNCVDPETPTDCVHKEQGATKGTRIFYNPDEVRIIRSGSKLLPSLGPDKNERYLAWAEAEQLKTGQRFFFGNTHLEVDKAEGYNELRRQQAQAVVDVIKTKNTADLPIVLVGDLNSSKWLDPSNAAYDVLIDAGLVDPLGNTYGSTLPSGYATAEETINRHINSWNGFERLARSSDPGTNGTYIDYVFTSEMRVPTWETVANVDSSGNYVGQIPSDHNMLYVTVGLP